MKRLPFNAEMMRKWLAGQKTQTRRVITPPPFDNGFQKVGDKYFDARHPAFGRDRSRYQVGDIVRLTEPIHNSHGFTSYVADEMPVLRECEDGAEMHRWSWKVNTLAARYLPNWACREFAKVTRVRWQHVQEISTEDIFAEGFSTALREHDAECDLREQFINAWNEINAKRGFPWEGNWWVFVYDLGTLVPGGAQ